MVFLASGCPCCLYLSEAFGSGGDAVLFFFGKRFKSVCVKNGKTGGFCLVSFGLDVVRVGAAALNDSFLAGVGHGYHRSFRLP